MTKLRIPDPPEVHSLRDGVDVHLPVEGETDVRWRQICDEHAVAEKVPAEAFGTDQRTVLIVTLPVGTSFEDVRTLLSRAEELLPETDRAREAERAAPRDVETSANWWFRNHLEFKLARSLNK